METWTNRQTWRLAKHWLLGVNLVAGFFIGLPYLAPILMRYGYTTPALVIYYAYKLTCHQFPSRSHFIFGHQAALCHRCSAIWGAFFLGGLLFFFLQHKLKPLPFYWWILTLIPIGLDGGTQLVGPLYEVLPKWWLSGFAIVVWLVLSGLLYSRRIHHWQYYLFVLCFPLGMLFVHVTGPRLSNWQLRTITGSITGLAYVWLLFPIMAETFQALQTQLENKFGSWQKDDLGYGK